jgi:hypothetical protein
MFGERGTKTKDLGWKPTILEGTRRMHSTDYLTADLLT